MQAQSITQSQNVIRVLTKTIKQNTNDKIHHPENVSKPVQQSSR